MSTSISLKKGSVWAHTEPFFKLMDVLKLKDLLNINALKLYYKYLHGTFPSYLYSFNIAAQDEIISITPTRVTKSWLIGQEHISPTIDCKYTCCLSSIWSQSHCFKIYYSRYLWILVRTSNDIWLTIILMRAPFRTATYAKEHYNCFS